MMHCHSHLCDCGPNDSCSHGICQECYEDLVDEITEDEDDSDEPISSCDNCGVNVYEDEDDGSGLCNQCQWFAAQNMPEQRASD